MARSFAAPALVCVLSSASAAQAQDAPTYDAAIAQPLDAGAAAAAGDRPLNFAAGVSLSETYASNSNGFAIGSSDDFITTVGFDAAVHDRGRLVTLDARYNFAASFYANGTQSTQITNYLEAVGSLTAIPDHLVIYAKAFAAPVTVSNVGIVTAGDRVVANGFRNSYGYYVQPDFRFRLGEFATSDTRATYGSTYFTNPAGSGPVIPIPGVAGPQDTNSRSLTQVFTSGEDFDLLKWSLAGVFSEIERKQGLLSEKGGTASLQYALSREFSLIGTFGYDAITATVPLTQNVSGIVALGGFSWTLGENFSVTVQAGRKYHSGSYIGNLRYNITPTSSIIASATDAVTTPEGQLLDSLTNLIATPSGSLSSGDDLLGNGSPASLPTFSPQGPANFGFDQNISRYQPVHVSYLQDFERNHAALSVFFARRTILSGVFIGPPTTDSWGVRATFARNISPRTIGQVGSSYTLDQQLGGEARSLRFNAQVDYAMSREMRLFFRGDYLDRQSSAALSAVSPFTRSLTDYELTIGISRAL